MKAHKYLLTDKRKAAVGPTESSPDDCWSAQPFIQQSVTVRERGETSCNNKGSMVQPATLWLRGVRLRPQSHKDTTRTFVIHLDHRSRTWTCLRRLEAKFRMSNTKSKHLWSEELEGMESFSSVFLDVFSVFWPSLSFVEATTTAEDQTSLVTRTAGLHSALNPGKRWLCGFAWRRFSLSTLPINGHAEWRGWKRGGGNR